MRVLVCSLASPGFVFPLVGLALRLRAAGHEVAFLTGSWATPLLIAQGLTVLPGGPCFQTRSWHAPEAVQAQASRLDDALARWPADLLLASALALGPLLVGEQRRLPTAVLGLLTPLWPTGEPVWDAQYSELMDACRGARRALGLVGAGPALPLLGALTLRRSWPGLEPGPSMVHDVGPLLWEPPADPLLARWLAGLDQPPIYLHQARSFGQAGFFEVAREALGDLPVAAAVSRMDGPPGAIPPAWFVRPHLSQGPVLAQASALVASGTTTTALGALSAGCPAVLLPAGSEQFGVSELLAQRGLAERLDPVGLTADRLRAAVLRAPERRAAAGQLAARMAQEPGEDPVALLEALARR